ncbi:unnamed protein product [Callosobruchus maculatus]|uniref:Uncharacterized protein n=1 Tax=Callosobruchus maculatus TaxID=64391 RepID=A0A653BYS0_CALMS|nr:unnamed protein product [Callosobruchus maculatus]
MPDWRINEKYRKPRRTKGTPFHKLRNYYALGVIGVAAAFWGLYELTPGAKKMRQMMNDKTFDYPDGFQMKIKHIQMGVQGGAGMEEFLAKAREREAQKQAKEKSWFFKLITSEPDL